MKLGLYVVIGVCLAAPSNAQDFKVVTSDITNFWEAYDSIKAGKNPTEAIQEIYLARASKGLRKFMKAKKLQANWYAMNLRKYPKFWESVRSNTEALSQRRGEIENVFRKFKALYPQFRPPDVYFTIGCLSSGGTTGGGAILIGSEIASADANTETSEFNGWHKSVIGNTGDIVAMVAHEAVHSQQKFGIPFLWGYLNHRVLTMSLSEGSADFVGGLLVGKTINNNIYSYGISHEKELWLEFQKTMMGNNLLPWLYNGGQVADRPADLGYFVGMRITASYYLTNGQNEKALKNIIRLQRMKPFLKKSKYNPT